MLRMVPSPAQIDIEQQFIGEDASAMARAGHIPGWVNVPFTKTFTRGSQTILPAGELRALYEQEECFPNAA